MDDPRWQPGMPVLDRQARDEPAIAPGRAARPRSVPETAPTPLQRHYVNLSFVALVAGAVAITALNLGAAPGSAIVKGSVLIAAPILLVTTADAAVRIWRSAWAWMRVDVGRGLFRLAWFASAVVLLALIVVAAWLVLSA